MNLNDQRAKELSVATRIAEGAKAAGREEFNADEFASLNAAMARVEELDVKIKANREGADILEKLGRLEPESGTTGHVLGLSDRKSFARSVMRNMTGYGKALAPAGTTVTAIDFLPDPVFLGRIPSNLTAALLAVKHPEPAYSYLVQGVRTNNASPVADLTLKPTTVLGLTRVDATLQVVAHLSEPVPRYWVTDNSGLQNFVSNDLLYGLGVALENQVVNGSGVAPQFRGILNTVGIQTQAAVGTDAFATARTAITKLQIVGQTAGLFVVHPTDWQKFETSRAVTSGVLEMLPGNSPVNSAAQALFGVPVVTTTAIAPGTALLIDRSAVAIDSHSTGVEIEWSSATGTDFQTNAVRARCEGRFNVSVYQPSAVVKITLP